MRKLNVSIIVGILVAVIGFVLVFAYGQNVDDRVADGRETRDVYVATSSLNDGETFSQIEGRIEKKAIPNAYLAENVIEDLEDLEGLVLLGPVAKDGQLTEEMFGSPEQARAVAPSEGRIAMAFSLSISPGVARYIDPGSYVDVFITYGSEGPEGEPTANPRTAEQRTKLAVSGVKVLAINAATVERDDDSLANSRSQQISSGIIAVLDVTPRQAELLVNGVTLGDLYLGLSAKEGDQPPLNKTPTGVVPDDVVVSNR